MTERPVHREPSNKRATNPFANRLLSLALIASSLLVGALIVATFGAPQAKLAQHASVDLSRSAVAPAAEPMKIVPADPLGKGAAWSPLTGDGSN